MLEHVFRRHRVVARLRAGPFGQHLAEFAGYLHNRGHAPMTVRLYLWAAEEFAHWLASRHLTPHLVDESIIGLFLRKRGPQGCRRSAAKLPRKNVRASLRHFLRMLRASGYAPAAAVELTSPIDCLLAEYDLYLGDVAGLAVATRCCRVRSARKFLLHVFGESPLRWERLQPEDVCTFVANFGQSGLSEAVATAATCVRSLLRWLQFQGHCLPNLLFAVPRLCQHRRHTLPTVMSEQQLHKFLGLFDRSTSAGRRDYAMVLCQVSLGFRVSEVAALKLDDIDWRGGTIRIAASKTRRGRVLPLTDGIGQAIADYLRHGRPATTCRHVFVRYTFPPGTPVSRSLISHFLRRAFAQVKGCESWKGAHVLRRTAATRMYRRGATLKEIGDVLGHRRLDTTAVYAKVEPTQLAAVPLPWPEEGQP